MNQRWYKPAIWLMWLALPITALKYWRNWDQLPLQMAVHFDANWQPNGYTSREGSLMLGLGIMVFMLVVFTIAGLIVRAQKPSASWPMLVIFYVGIGLLWFVNNSIVEWNLNPPPAHSELMGTSSPAVRDSGGTKVLALHL
ncbi:MAG: DUF1648 domain-containing protein [Candidatus Sulfotelmatobacter sp.]